jgi:hypothetical protein
MLLPAVIGVGRVLDKVFSMMRSHFWLVYGITLVIYVPFFFYNLAMRQFQISIIESASPMFMKTDTLLYTFAMAMGFVLVMSLLWPFGTLASTTALARRHLGQETSVWLAYREVLRLFWHVVGLFLLWATILSVGYLMCFVPGIYLFYRFFLAFPAFMVERRGIMDALSRSAELMRGNYLRVIVLHMIISFVVKAALASGITYSGAALFAGTGTVSILAYALSQFLGQLFVAPLDILLAVAVYFEIRERREGLDLEILGEDLERSLAPGARSVP